MVAAVLRCPALWHGLAFAFRCMTISYIRVKTLAISAERRYAVRFCTLGFRWHPRRYLLCDGSCLQHLGGAARLACHCRRRSDSRPLAPGFLANIGHTPY